MAINRGTSTSWLVPVFALFVATFAVGTAELIVGGLLPPLARDLGVDIPTAGLLISGYAIGVAVASPVLAILSGGLSRRLVLLLAMSAFIVGNLLCAVASTYLMMLGARLVVACCHGIFFGVAMVIAMGLAPEGRKTSAVSLVVAGVTLSTIVGVPVGTAIGNAFGWRLSFVAIAVAGVLALGIIALLLPRDSRTGETSNLRAELRAATRPVVLIGYSIIIFFMIGVFTIFAYVVPLLTNAGVPVGMVPWVLFGMGFTGFFGNLAGGRLGDWRPTATMVAILSGALVLLVAMWTQITSAWGLAAVFWLLWLIGFGFPSVIQTRILKGASEAPNFAATLISTAFNIGIAGGAAVGGAALAAGWGYPSLPLLDVVFTTLALLTTLGLGAYDMRGQAAAQPA